MTAEHIRALNGIGFDGGTSQTDWSVRFQQLCEYKAKFGVCLVPKEYSANPQLGWWVLKQRYFYKLYQEGKPSPMTAERIRDIEEIGFEWDTAWNERCEQLCEFKIQFGHCLVPIKYSGNPKLGRWASKQRHQCKLYQEGKPTLMTAERIRELENVGIEWKQNSPPWSER